jgi:hypothetical protein
MRLAVKSVRHLWETPDLPPSVFFVTILSFVMWFVVYKLVKVVWALMR